MDFVLHQMDEMNAKIFDLRSIHDQYQKQIHQIQILQGKILSNHFNQDIKTIYLQNNFIVQDIQYIVQLRKQLYDFVYNDFFRIYTDITKLYNRIYKRIPIPENIKKVRTSEEYKQYCYELYQKIYKIDNEIQLQIQQYQYNIHNLTNIKIKGFYVSKLLTDFTSQIDTIKNEKMVIFQNLKHILSEFNELSQQFLVRMETIITYWTPTKKNIIMNSTNMGNSSSKQKTIELQTINPEFENAILKRIETNKFIKPLEEAIPVETIEAIPVETTLEVKSEEVIIEEETGNHKKKTRKKTNLKSIF